MVKSRFIRAFIIGICLTLMSSTAAFAETGAGVSGESRGQVEILPAQPGMDSGVIDKATMEKQSEIDAYVFKEHIKEIEEKGFKVTHTAPMDGFVEVGINPYSEENAEYLYKIFGKDMVKVVEGQQAVTVSSADAGNAADISSVSPDKPVSGQEPAGNIDEGITRITNEAEDGILYTMADTKAESTAASGHDTSLILLIAGGAVILLGGLILITRRLRPANR